MSPAESFSVEYGGPGQLATWAMEQLGQVKPIGVIDHMLVVKRRAEVRGVVLLTDLTDNNVMMHVASDGSAAWINHEALAQIFSFVFGALHLGRATGLVHSENARSINFMEHIGFVRETQIANFTSQGDLLIYAMWRNNCRWIGPSWDSHGQTLLH